MSLKKNIIYLHFKGKHLITSKSQYQYNYGQYLYFADLNLPQAFEVHFSNKERGESETQIGSNKLVEIPDKYFWNSALEIYAWVYLHDETNDGKTIYEVRIPLIKRARPTDKEPLPDQQSAIDKAIAELNNALNITNENADKTNADKTQVATIKEEVVTLKEEIDSTANAVSQDAQSANTAAERSEQSAQNSAESERKALDYSDEAKDYAQSAFESKNTASQKAQVATNASAEAKDFRDEAETFKNEAEQIKQNVVDYRNETKGYRDEALTAKNDAQDSVNAAQKTSEQMTQAGAEIIENVRDVGSKYAAQAETAASNAQTSAESASVSATASANSASASAQIKADVEDLADDAQGYAQASAQSASASANSASQAQGYAQSASASAQSASGYASNAQTSANTASNKASEASTSAQTASNKASEASQSATNASQSAQTAEQAKTASQTAQGLAESARDSAVSAKTDAESAKADAESARDEAQQAVASISGALAEKAPVITDTASGAIASFTDGADDLPLKSLVIDINPVQDLHGQDSPYPAGGGKNLAYLEQGTLDFDKDGSEVSSTTRVRTEFIPIEVNVDYVASSGGWIIKNGVAYDADKNYIGYGLYPNGSGAFKITDSNVKYVRFIYGNSENTDCTPSDMWYQFEKGSTATAYAPYENICPISGWTQGGVEQRGKNLLSPNFNDYSRSNAYLYILNVVPQNASARFTFTDKDTTIDVSNCHIGFVREAPASVNIITEYRWCVSNGSIQSNVSNLSTHGLFCGNVFIYPNTKDVFDRLFARWDIMVELGSTATPYEPYTGRSITINLGQTVYGGKLDVLSGELTVDRAMVDLGTLTWQYSGTMFFSTSAPFFGDGGSALVGSVKNVCEIYENAPVTLSNPINGRFNVTNVQALPVLRVSDNRFTDASSLKTALNGVKAVFELATPITIQLTPQQVNSLLGVNNIWADSGDTTAEYRADTKAYIAKKIAEAISALS